MLFLQFTNDDDRYVIEANDVIEVVPYASLKKVPHAPPYIAGLLNYRGKTIPVIDICHIMGDRACRRILSTRIVLVNYTLDAGQRICIGLLIEHITETVKIDESAFSASGVNLEENAYLGGVVIDDKGIVQRVHVDSLLPEEARQILAS